MNATVHVQEKEFTVVDKTLDRYGIFDIAGAAIISATLAEVIPLSSTITGLITNKCSLSERYKKN